MKSMKSKSTTRKFYNKWYYKISLKCKSASILRSMSLEAVLQLHCNNNDPEGLGTICKALISYDKTLYATRIEGKRLDIYTNSKEMFQDLVSKLSPIIQNLVAPTSESLSLLTENNILTKKYPHNRYQHKVFLYPHKLANDISAKQTYINWLETQNPRILISEKTKEWFIKTNWNWDRRYLYVEDEKTLLLLKLRNPEVIGRIYKYVIPINN
jgi:hypothetical protein